MPPRKWTISKAGHARSPCAACSAISTSALSGSGLIGGGHLASQLETGLEGHAALTILPIRFAAIATEFNTGHEIWLTRGRLSDALRASYALPGIFPPVLIGGRWLVDGALVNPVPVSAARALGARLGDRRQSQCRPVRPRYDHRQSWLRRRRDRCMCRPNPTAFAGCSTGERSLAPAVLRPTRASRIADRHGRSLQRHAGPHHARAACGRSARCPDQSAARRHRLVRFPSRRRGDGDRQWRPPTKALDAVSEAVTALSQPGNRAQD